MKGISVWKCHFHTEAKTCWFSSEVCHAQKAGEQTPWRTGTGRALTLTEALLYEALLHGLSRDWQQGFHCCFYLEGAVALTLPPLYLCGKMLNQVPKPSLWASSDNHHCVVHRTKWRHCAPNTSRVMDGTCYIYGFPSKNRSEINPSCMKITEHSIDNESLSKFIVRELCLL